MHRQIGKAEAFRRRRSGHTYGDIVFAGRHVGRCNTADAMVRANPDAGTKFRSCGDLESVLANRALLDDDPTLT